MTTPRTYTLASSARYQALLALGSGFFGLVVGGVMLAQRLGTAPQGGTIESLIPGAVGGIVGVSVMSLLFGYNLARGPTRITVDGTGLLLEGLLAKVWLAWGQIAELQRRKMQRHARKPKVDVLVLRDEGGKTLARIPGTFEGFADLVADIETRSTAARGAPTYNRAKEIARKLARQKREQRLLAGVAVFFLAGGLFLTWTGMDEVVHERALSAEGKVGEAGIMRRYLMHSTPRVEYRFIAAGGAAVTRDTALTQMAWERLDGADKVLIVYLPSDPNWSHVLIGEVSLTGPPMQGVLMGLFMLASGTGSLVLLKKGYCGFESRNGKLRLVRLGDVDDALEAAPATKP